MEQSELICVRRIKGKGRGVFARRAIAEGTVIERAPILLAPIEHLVGGMHSPLLGRFFYLWNRNKVALSLGYGSLYNHSYAPNAHYRHGSMAITYFALRNISKGEEITINYNGDPEDASPVGFEVIESRNPQADVINRKSAISRG
jgi:SET domain-containing protein